MNSPRIYTRTGDDGTTGLLGGQRIKKSAARIESYGTIDELSCIVGLARTALAEVDAARAGDLDAWLAWTQDVLFNLGSDLATLPQDRRPDMPVVRDADAAALERAIDESQRRLPELRAFIHPGGSKPAVYLQLARTVTRRAERLLVALADSESIEPQILRYVNRLSDAFFVWARRIDHALGRTDVLWNPKTAPPGEATATA